MPNSRPSIPLLKPLVFLSCLVPAMLLFWRVATDGLGANPIEAIIHSTGEWTLNLLFLTLAATPLRRLSGWHWPVALRRLLGLFAFFYACLHLAAYVWLDRSLDFASVLEDVLKRPYISVGLAAFLLMLPLALTSTRGWMRRLGRNWKRLHRAVYLIAGLGVLHFLWLVKADLREPLVYATLLGLLMLMRLPGVSLSKVKAVRSGHPSDSGGC